MDKEDIKKEVESGSLLLRPAGPDDFAEVLGLIKEYKPGRQFDEEAQKRIFEQVLRDQDVRVWVADAGEHLVGMFSLHLHAHLHHEAKVGFIEDFVVYKQFWGLLVRTRLFQKALELALENGCGTMEVTSSIESREMLNFFEENDFVKTSYKLVKKLEQ